MRASLRRCVVVARSLPLAMAVIGLLLIEAAPVSAQVKEITKLKNLSGREIDLAPYKVPQKMNQLRGAVFPLVNEGKAVGQQMLDFETYYLARIAELTWDPTVTNTNGAEVKRGVIKRDMRQYGGASSQELHDVLNKLALLHLPVIAADNEVSLNARFNALVLLGQIDRIDSNLSTAQPAIPHVDVTPILVGAFDKQDLAEPLRIAALMGLARQSELQVVAGARPQIAGAAAKLIVAKKPLTGFTTNGHHWARKLALQMVIGLAKSGNDMNRPETVKALYEIISDPNEPLFLRRDASLALGQIDPATLAAGQVKPLDLLKALSGLTREMLKAGTPRPNPAAEPSLTKAEDVFLPPSEDKEIKKFYTEGLSYYLNCIATALGGRNTRGLRPATASDTTTQKLVEALLRDHIEPAIAAIGKSNVTATALPQDMSTRGGELEKWINTNKLAMNPPAAAANAVAGP